MDSIESWVYPNHGDSSAPSAYVPWRRRLESDDYQALIDNDFSPVEDLSLDSTGYVEASEYKRSDMMGRVVYVSPCGKSGGKIRVTHAYLNHKIHTTFDMDGDYALDLLAGKSNAYLFYVYPAEGGK